MTRKYNSNNEIRYSTRQVLYVTYAMTNLKPIRTTRLNKQLQKHHNV